MVTFARSRNAKEEERHQLENVGPTAAEWFLMVWLLSLHSAQDPAVFAARQVTQLCKCTNTHLGGDKMENSLFSSAQPSPPLAAWQPFSAIYLWVGNNIDIHLCSHEGTKRSNRRDSGSTGACCRWSPENCSPQWLLLWTRGQALHLKCHDSKF